MDKEISPNKEQRELMAGKGHRSTSQNEAERSIEDVQSMVDEKDH